MNYRQVCNDPDGLQELIEILEGAGKSNREAYASLISFLEDARRSGNLEEENYQQFNAPGVFGGYFKANFKDIYEKELPAMVQHVRTLKQKLDDYWNWFQ